MKHSRSPGIALFVVGTALVMAAVSAQAAMRTAAECRLPLTLLSAPDLDELGCLPSAGNALDAYLTGRKIESRRSAALRDTKRELAKTESRMVRKSADLALAATAATHWVRRQPGRDLPPAYRQRVVSAAAAILAEDLQRQRLESACDEVNREYDRKLNRALRVNS